MNLETTHVLFRWVDIKRVGSPMFLKFLGRKEGYKGIEEAILLFANTAQDEWIKKKFEKVFPLSDLLYWSWDEKDTWESWLDHSQKDTKEMANEFIEYMEVKMEQEEYMRKLEMEEEEEESAKQEEEALAALKKAEKQAEK